MAVVGLVLREPEQLGAVQEERLEPRGQMQPSRFKLRQMGDQLRRGLPFTAHEPGHRGGQIAVGQRRRKLHRHQDLHYLSARIEV
jgi:hypothetical protein